MKSAARDLNANCWLRKFCTRRLRPSRIQFKGNWSSAVTCKSHFCTSIETLSESRLKWCFMVHTVINFCIYYVNLISSPARVVNWQFGCQDLFDLFCRSARSCTTKSKKEMEKGSAWGFLFFALDLKANCERMATSGHIGNLHSIARRRNKLESRHWPLAGRARLIWWNFILEFLAMRILMSRVN